MTEQEVIQLLDSKLNQGKYTLKTLVISCLIAFAAGCFTGAYITKVHFPTLNTEVKPVVTEKVKTVTETQIAYVPKETIKYIDKATGKEANAKEDTDVQLTADKPKVGVMVNGKPYKFDLLQGEEQKFEDGKIAMRQTASVDMDIEIPTIDLTRHNVLTIGAMFSNGKAAPAAGFTGTIGKKGAYQIVGSQIGGYAGVGIKF